MWGPSERALGGWTDVGVLGGEGEVRLVGLMNSEPGKSGGLSLCV